jgi:hypothetical protein
LLEIFDIYQSASQSPEYRRITGLPSFQALAAVLGEYVTTPDERLRRQLFVAANELDRSLEQFKTGTTWQQFLEVAPGKTLSADETNQAPPALDASDLARLLIRFDSVEQNDDYRVIAAVPAFKATHNLLAAYLSQPRVSSPAGIEELPTPGPAVVR